MWMHCQAPGCGRLFRVEQDIVRASCPDCKHGPVRAASPKHADLAEHCRTTRVVVSISPSKKKDRPHV